MFILSYLIQSAGRKQTGSKINERFESR